MRPKNFPPITPEGLAKLGVEPQLIPFIISASLQVEQSPNDSPPLNSVEAEAHIEILDKVLSSATVNPSLKNICFPLLRKASPAHGILPRSYYPPGITLSDTIPYVSGGFADIWKGQRDGNQLCVKTFRTQTAASLDKIKRRFYHEIVGWKYVSHPNVQPFLGVSESLFSFSIISPWLTNGNIVEYTQKHRGANRIQLLAQAACGLEYLHSQGIIHSNIHPGNILIAEEGKACLGDFGITGIITDPTAVEPGSTTTYKPGAVRYMAPELLNPPQFSLPNSNPSKESDIYSLAMTAFETLTEVLPYGNARDGIIIFQVVSGERPPRPTDTRWLQDHLWHMIETCWSEKREQRWNIHAVCNQFLRSSIQEAPDVIEPDDRVTPTVVPPKDPFLAASFVKLEEAGPPVQRGAKTEWSNHEKELRPQTAPVPNTPKGEISNRNLELPNLPPGKFSEPWPDPGVQGKRTRKSTILSRGMGRLRVMADVLKGLVKSRKPLKADRGPSQ